MKVTNIIITLVISVAIAAAAVYANNKGYFPGSLVDKETGKIAVS